MNPTRTRNTATPIALVVLAAGTAAYAYVVDRGRVSDADRDAWGGEQRATRQNQSSDQFAFHFILLNFDFTHHHPTDAHGTTAPAIRREVKSIP